MRVLRLGNSNDGAGPLPPEQRAWKVAERRLAEATGEPVETILKRAWPNDALPGLIERWMAELRPDMVVIQVNNFWFAHESAPLWFERHLGKPGHSFNRLGLKLGNASWLADSRWAQMVNRRVLTALPKATYFTIPEVVSAMEAAMRRALAHEGTILLVRGHESWAVMPMATPAFNRRNNARNTAMSIAMRTACERMRVPYYQRPVLQPGEVQTLNGAGFHNNAEGERRLGEFDGEAMLDAWRSAHALP